MAFVIKTCWSKLLNYVFMLLISCHAWSSVLSVNGSVHILVASWACSALQISCYLQDWSSATSCNDHFLGFVFTLIVIYRMFKGRHLTICICGHEFFWEWFHRHTPVQISLTGSVLLILHRICCHVSNRRASKRTVQEALTKLWDVYELWTCLVRWFCSMK